MPTARQEYVFQFNPNRSTGQITNAPAPANTNASFKDNAYSATAKHRLTITFMIRKTRLGMAEIPKSMRASRVVGMGNTRKERMEIIQPMFIMAEMHQNVVMMDIIIMR